MADILGQELPITIKGEPDWVLLLLLLNYSLVIVGVYLIKCLRLVAYRASLWSLDTDNHVAAIATLPQSDSTFLEHFMGLNIT